MSSLGERIEAAKRSTREAERTVTNQVAGILDALKTVSDDPGEPGPCLSRAEINSYAMQTAIATQLSRCATAQERIAASLEGLRLGGVDAAMLHALHEAESLMGEVPITEQTDLVREVLDAAIARADKLCDAQVSARLATRGRVAEVAP